VATLLSQTMCATRGQGGKFTLQRKPYLLQWGGKSLGQLRWQLVATGGHHYERDIAEGAAVANLPRHGGEVEAFGVEGWLSIATAQNRGAASARGSSAVGAGKQARYRAMLSGWAASSRTSPLISSGYRAMKSLMSRPPKEWPTST